MAGGLIPAFKVTVDGRDVGAAFFHRFSQLTLAEQRGGEADQLDITLDDHDGRTPLPPEGAPVTVALGYEGQGLVDKGRFTVDDAAWAGAPDVVTLRARSADFTKSFAIRREQSWRGKTLGDVLAAVAGRQGLRLAIAEEFKGVAMPVVDQSRESDAALLRRLGRQFDAAATVKAGRLLFTPIGQGRSASGAALPAVTLTRAAGDQYSYERPKREDHPGVTAEWHDYDAAHRRKVTVGEADGAKRLRRVYGNEADARRAATSAMKRVGRARATFSINLALGRPDLYPERPVVLSGFKAEVDAAQWVIDSVTHSLGESGLTTSVKLETVG